MRHECWAACALSLSAACESQCAPVCHMAVEVMVSSMRIGQIECVVKYESTRAVVHSLLVPLGPHCSANDVCTTCGVVTVRTVMTVTPLLVCRS